MQDGLPDDRCFGSKEILQKGEINYQKSDLRASPDPKYALEVTPMTVNMLRIVFAESPRGPVVITVIDLEKECIVTVID
jgi:hypothetical protein